MFKTKHKMDYPILIVSRCLGIIHQKERLNINSKTCVKQPLKIDKTKILMTSGSLMKVKCCRMLPLEHSATLLP